MSLSSSLPHRASAQRKSGHLGISVSAGVIAAAAAMLVIYLLWPTWRPSRAGDPASFPISIGGTVFNVPAAAIRMKSQRYSGPQERIDLNFEYPSLQPPGPPSRVTAEMIGNRDQPIGRIFMSIAAHHDAMPPEVRVRTIYPRYLDERPAETRDGLSVQAFRSGTPYENEDLMTAAAPAFTARCSRDGETPGTCLSERRVGNADLTFRFSRKWLTRWSDVAIAMDHLTDRLHRSRSR
jgi:hypothetical protein